MTAERIKQAAIRENGVVYTLPRPARHHTIMGEMCDKHGFTHVDGCGQGFVTDADRFVDRIEGAAIAIAAGQIAALRWPPNLYSEDLW
jgi:hypothetical protein